MTDRLTREDVVDALDALPPLLLMQIPAIAEAARWASTRLPHSRCPKCDGEGKWVHPSNSNIGYVCPMCGGTKVTPATLAEDLVEKTAEVLSRYIDDTERCIVAARAVLAELANGDGHR